MAMHSPDAAWIAQERWDKLSAKEQEHLPPLCPDFVIELRLRTDSLAGLQKKIASFDTTLSGEEVLPGFTLDLRELK
jgi:Uma2 family endonuclease